MFPLLVYKDKIADIYAGSIIFIMFILCLNFAWNTGQTVDETFYNGSGYLMVKYNNYDVLGEHPPLIMQAASLPLLILKPKFSLSDIVSLKSGSIDISATGSKFLYQKGNNPQIILFIERTVIILLTVLLAILLYHFGCRTYGKGGALIALTLFCFSPDIIANGSLYTTDMGITFFFFLTIYQLKIFSDLVSVSNAIKLGVCLGLALVSKINSIFLYPIITVIFLWLPFEKGWRARKIRIPTYINKLLIILTFLLIFLSFRQRLVFIILLPLFWCILGFSIDRHSVLQKRIFQALGFSLLVVSVTLVCTISIKQGRPFALPVAVAIWLLVTIFLNMYLMQKHRDNEKVIFLSKSFILVIYISALVVCLDYTDFFKSLFTLRPFSHYIQSFNCSIMHAVSAHHVSYVSGSFIRPDSLYFLKILFIKLPVIATLLFVFGLLNFDKMALSKGNAILIGVPLIIYFLGASLIGSIRIGVRHILPVYPFIFLVAGNSFNLIRGKIRNTALQRIATIVLCVGLLATIGRTVSMYPNFLSFFNEIIGTEDKGISLININAGQDNRQLAIFAKKHNISLMHIGSISPNSDEYRYYQMNWKIMDENTYKNPGRGFYALDYETYRNEQTHPESYFKGRKPIFQIGKTYYIFKVD